MRHQAPPLQAIQAFIMAVDAPSFRAAADELALSPSAFSRRIETLERYLGVNLFDRTGTRPELTALGRDYYQRVRPAVDTICRATLEAAERPAGGLRVQFPQSLAMGWLLPQLAELTAARDSVDVTLTIHRDVRNLYAGDCDVGVVSSPRDLHGLPVEDLIPLEAGVVAAPGLMARQPSLSNSRLNDHTLYGPSEPPDAWNQWLTQAGHAGAAPRLQRYETIAVSYEAVAAGLGLGLGLPMHIDRYLHDRRLMFCRPEIYPTGYSYLLVYRDERTRRRADVQRFAEWVHCAASRSLRQFHDAAHAAA